MATVTIATVTTRRGDDAVLVVGTVDGRSREVVLSLALLKALTTKAQRVAYVARQLKAVDDDDQAEQDGRTLDLAATVEVP